MNRFNLSGRSISNSGTDGGEAPRASVRRRALLGATAAASGAAALGSGAATAAPGAGTDGGARGASAGLPAGLAADFARPGLATAAGFRWWWPHGEVDPVQIAREVDQVADAGFGILEVADVTHSLRARNIQIDLVQHGWGTSSWKEGVLAALRQADRRGVRIDLTVGPSWPAAVSTITPDDPAACTELAHGLAEVAGGETFDAEVPAPVVAPSSYSTASSLVGVQAFRSGVSDRNGLALEPDSLVELSGDVVEGRLRWTAPPEGDWVVLSYWSRGSGQEPEAGPHTSPRSFVVDHFSAAGSRAVIDLWEKQILGREMRRLLGRAGGYLFEDSLEIETDATIWTPLMLEEFEARAGYDLRPYLAAVVEEDEKYQFTFGNPVTTRVRDDFNQVLSDLYRDHHLLALRAFARTLGMGLRVQPYGLETDAVEHSALLDQPESESLGFKNLDDYRVMSGGRDLGGRTVLSCEAACYFGAAYQTTWERALQTLNSIMAAGVNQAVLHGFAYADAPGVTWPGFAAFSPYYNGAIGYGEAWGPRTPQWEHMPDIAGYLARTQLVLQTGRPTYDVVFLRQKGWASTGIGPFWSTREGIPVGWSHSFATEAALDLADARVEGGLLAPEGPSYKAMIVGPDQFRGQEITIEVAMARRLAEYARSGLPVVLLGSWAAVEPVGLAQDGEVAEVRDLLAEVISRPTTRVVADQYEIPLALDELGVRRDVEHEFSDLMHVRRQVGRGRDKLDLYYLANAKHAENRRLNPLSQDVWLTSANPEAVPLELDAWSGEVRPVAVWERRGDRVRVRVDLTAGQATMIALVPPRRRMASAVSTTAEALRADGAKLVARVSQAGTVEATAADGTVRRATVSDVPAAPTIDGWDLEVEDWRPGSSADETVKPVRRLRVDTLAPWSEIALLEDVSGVGRYRTTVDLGRRWSADDGAILDLGVVEDTFRVRVNGSDVGPCDPLDTRVDVGPWLRRGRNTIEVEVTTTLINRLRTVTPDVYGVAARQRYGLIGPVALEPYTEVRLR